MRIETEPTPGVRGLLDAWQAAKRDSCVTSVTLDAAHAARSRGERLNSRAVDGLASSLVEVLGDLHDRAVTRAAEAEHAFAAALLETGPTHDDLNRYQGIDLGGMLRVIRTPMEFRPECGHAACDVDGETA